MDLEQQHCNGLTWEDVKIMAQASVSLPGNPATTVEIRRGMRITTIEGREAGKVAGVAVRQDRPKAICLILSRLPEDAGYQSLPVGLIARVEGDTIMLNATYESILDIPEWHSV